MKLDVHANGRSLTAMNDIIVHNADPRHGIRYHLYVDGKPVGGEIIGDGIVAATPLGSTGYYRSITDSFFTVGIGIAFNNSTEQSDHMVSADTSIMKLMVVRGPAVVYADNQPATIELSENDEVVIARSAATARLITVEP
jgi:NAD+ kinase